MTSGLITAIIVGALVGAFGAPIEKRVREWKNSWVAVLAAFVLLGMVVALVVTSVKWVF